MGQEYFGSIEDVEMLKQSHFDLQYKYEDKGAIKRLLTFNEKKSAQFSKSYEVLRFFEFKKHNQEYSSVVV